MAQLVGAGVIRTDDERLDDAEPLPYSGLGLVVLARPEPIGSRNCGSASELTAGTASHFLGFQLLDNPKSLDHCIKWIQCSLARVKEPSGMQMQIIVLCIYAVNRLLHRVSWRHPCSIGYCNVHGQ